VQASYVSKVAGYAHRGDRVELRRLLKGLAFAVAAVGAATVITAALVGPELVVLIYGAEYVVGRDAAVLVALGVVLYLAAAVTNDVAVALGEFRWVQASWVTGALVAGGIVASVDEILLRSTVPLIVGSVAAASLLGGAVIRSVRANDRVPA